MQNHKKNYRIKFFSLSMAYLDPFSLNKLEIIFEIFLHDKLKNNEIIKNICIARASAKDAKKFLLICSLVAELLKCIRLFKEKSLNKVLLIL